MKRASRRDWLAGPRAGGPGLHGRRVEGLRLALASGTGAVLAATSSQCRTRSDHRNPTV